jgi:ATP-dependent Lon protease
MKTILNKNIQSALPEMLPVIPTMDVVVFPHAIVPLLVLDGRIITGINQALQGSKLVFLLAAKKQLDDQGAIGTKDLYQVGTVASIMRLIKIPEGGVKILVQGLYKASAKDIAADTETLRASVERYVVSKQVMKLNLLRK